MRICKNCGSQISDSAKFCTSCGAPVVQETGQNQQQEYGGQNFQNTQSYGNSYQAPEYNHYGCQPQVQTSGFAVAALVLGIAGIFLGILGMVFTVGAIVDSGLMILAFLFYLPSILAIVFGIGGILKTGNGGARGRGLAIAGLVLGIVFLLIYLFLGLFVKQLIPLSGDWSAWYWMLNE